MDWTDTQNTAVMDSYASITNNVNSGKIVAAQTEFDNASQRLAQGATIDIGQMMARPVVKTPVPASTQAGDLLNIAMQIIFGNEGSYSTVVKDDGKDLSRNYPGGVSIGKLQWHESRAYDLLAKIKNMDETAAKLILGEHSAVFKELSDANLAKNSQRWSGRVLSDSEAVAISKLLATDIGKQLQAAQAAQSYLDIGRSLGISDEQALIYFSDLYNQSPARAVEIVSRAGGGNGLSLEKIHQAALANDILGKYITRRTTTYNKIKAAWNTPSSIGGENPGTRSAANYNEILNNSKFDLTKNYMPQGNTTYCNIFTRDVMQAMGAFLPDNMRANDLYIWLDGAEAKKEGWVEVSAADSQKAANEGKPTVVSWFNSTGESGHIAVVRPYANGEVFNNNDIAHSVVVANAGTMNNNYTTINWVFKSNMIPQLKFYTHP